MGLFTLRRVSRSSSMNDWKFDFDIASTFDALLMAGLFVVFVAVEVVELLLLLSLWLACEGNALLLLGLALFMAFEEIVFIVVAVVLDEFEFKLRLDVDADEGKITFVSFISTLTNQYKHKATISFWAALSSRKVLRFNFIDFINCFKNKCKWRGNKHETYIKGSLGQGLARIISRKRERKRRRRRRRPRSRRVVN